MCLLLMTRAKYLYLWSDFIFKFSKTGREQAKCLKVLHGFTQKVNFY